MLELNINIDRIPPEGQVVQGQLSAELLQERLDQHGATGFNIKDPAEVHLRLNRIEDTIQLSGHIHCGLNSSCGRCLAESTSLIELDIDMTLFKGSDEASERAEELDLDEQNLDLDGPSTATYRGESIDLGDLIREQLLVELPMAPLCHEDCAGLCFSCGANLNQGSCGCVHDTIDLRWQALKDIKISQ